MMPGNGELGVESGARAPRVRVARGRRSRAELRVLFARVGALAAWWLLVLSLAAREARAQAPALRAASRVAAAPARGDSVAVAARTLPRGHTLAADDVAWISGDSAAALGHRVFPTPDTPRPAPGSVTRRVVAAGEPLREPAITAPQAITAGQRVAVVYRDGGVELRMQGTALGAAPRGGRVAVRLDDRRRLTGTAAGDGVVTLR